jgi:serine/threonine protein kinase
MNGLKKLQAENLVHRDLKPSNIFLSDGIFKLGTTIIYFILFYNFFHNFLFILDYDAVRQICIKYIAVTRTLFTT